MDDAKRKGIEAANDAVGARHGGMKPGFDEIEAAIDAYEAAMLEAGWKMTPREVDGYMHSKGYAEIRSGGHAMTHRTWKAMWHAAPSQETNDE